MINGPGIAGKYALIVDGYEASLRNDAGSDQAKADDVYEFTKIVKNATPQEFEEWFNLYAPLAPTQRRKNRSATVHKRTT